jgi:hypothetical protein
MQVCAVLDIPLDEDVLRSAERKQAAGGAAAGAADEQGPGSAMEDDDTSDDVSADAHVPTRQLVWLMPAVEHICKRPITPGTRSSTVILHQGQLTPSARFPRLVPLAVTVTLPVWCRCAAHV